MKHLKLSSLILAIILCSCNNNKENKKKRILNNQKDSIKVTEYKKNEKF